MRNTAQFASNGDPEADPYVKQMRHKGDLKEEGEPVWGLYAGAAATQLLPSCFQRRLAVAAKCPHRAAPMIPATDLPPLHSTQRLATSKALTVVPQKNMSR
jgi:hypothetical protein